jgi:hypothetical protein
MLNIVVSTANKVLVRFLQIGHNCLPLTDSHPVIHFCVTYAGGKKSSLNK